MKSNSNASKESPRPLFSYHPSPETAEGETYAYLLRNETFNSKRGKALANQAIVAWWLPYARQDHPEQARKTAIDCIEQLEQHIAKLRRDFQIPLATLPYQPHYQVPYQQLPYQVPYQDMTALPPALPVAAPSAAVSQLQASQLQASQLQASQLQPSQTQTSPPISAHTASETALTDDSLYGQFDMEEALETE